MATYLATTRASSAVRSYGLLCLLVGVLGAASAVYLAFDSPVVPQDMWSCWPHAPAGRRHREHLVQQCGRDYARMMLTTSTDGRGVPGKPARVRDERQLGLGSGCYQRVSVTGQIEAAQVQFSRQTRR